MEVVNEAFFAIVLWLCALAVLPNRHVTAKHRESEIRQFICYVYLTNVNVQDEKSGYFT